MTFKIEKDIPPPPAGRGRKEGKYPLADMEVGDSFYIEGAAEFAVARTSCYGAAKRLNIIIQGNKDKDGDGGRIWRIK